MLDVLTDYVGYIYLRYLLVTELYMVEKWERIMIHIVFFILFAAISLFNATVVLGFTSRLRTTLFDGYLSQKLYDTLFI